MGYLDDIPDKRFTPPNAARFKVKDNFEELQNDGMDFVTEDFSDSRFADRKELPEEE